MLSYDNKLFDRTIYTKDSMAGTSIVICTLIRMAIGAIIVAGYMNKWIVVTLCVIILYVFFGKYMIVGDSSWKCYPKVLISYLTILGMQFSSDESVRRGAGYIMMIESLIGLNSRHLATKLAPA